MAASQDLLFQNLTPTQGSIQPVPVTMAAATTIAPSTFLTKVTGTTNIATITPPIAGAHMLALIFTTSAPGSILTTGNVLVGTTTINQNVPVYVIYDPVQAKYYVNRGAV